MPLLQPAEQFLVAEYERFMDGLSKLKEGDFYDQRNKALQTLQDEGKPQQVTIPGWDDTIHLAPRTALSPNDVRAHFRAQRRGEPSPLTPQQQAELERRQKIRERIQNSASPDYAQAFGQMLTAIDNVQDALITLSVVGRIVLWPVSKILGRAVPGLGWVLLASDLLNLLTFIGQLAIPLYAALCKSPTQALAAGVPAAVFGRALKTEVWTLAELNPFSRRARAVRRLTASRLMPTVSEALQVAQTTDQWFGVGVSLGAIVGAITESAYGLEARLRGKPVEVKLPDAGRDIQAIQAGVNQGRSLQDIETRRQASQTLQQAPQVLRTQENFTEDEHLEVLTAYLAALDLVAADLKGTGWQERLPLNPAWTLTPPIPHRSIGPALAEFDPEFRFTMTRWGYPSSPPALSAGALITQTSLDVPRALREFLAPRRNSPTGAYYGALVNTVTQRLWMMLEEDDHLWKIEPEPDWRVLAALAESNRLVNLADGEEKIIPFWAAAKRAVAQDDKRTLLAEELDGLARQHGMTLIRLAGRT